MADDRVGRMPSRVGDSRTAAASAPEAHLEVTRQTRADDDAVPRTNCSSRSSVVSETPERASVRESTKKKL